MAAKKDEKVEAKDELKPVVIEDKAAEKASEPVVEAQPDKPSAEAPAATEEKPDDEKVEAPAKAEDVNTVLVQAIRSFEGIEGDKGPSSEPFRVSRQRYADLKANDLVKLVDEKAGSDPH